MKYLISLLALIGMSSCSITVDPTTRSPRLVPNQEILDLIVEDINQKIIEATK